ncbi:uncharacterized protein AB9W97_008283 isoform 2-T3 [Spinachia spinachia]
MPKYCSVPNCKNDSGNGSDRKSFYKFPLQDPVRLQQWLSNMRRGSSTPSRHQYICHEHFAPSSFKVRWGIRYLESDAVPTVFREVEKRKAVDPSEPVAKRPHAHYDKNMPLTGDGTPAVDGAEREDGTAHGIHLYKYTVDPLPQGESSRLEASDAGKSDRPLQADLESVTGFKPVPSFPLFQTGRHLTNSGEVVVMSEGPFGQGPGELAAILTLSEEPSEGTQVLAYLETMPSVFLSEPVVRPDTVLASALSSEPITSTLPIVSKHTSASATSQVLTVERLETGEEDNVTSEEEDGGAELLDRQLEEHCYHKSSLSKEQLEAIVGELQKKVKVLQQRHRRHLEKLLGLENTACIQTGSVGLGVGETVTIIYEEEDDNNAAYLYTPLVAD